MYREAFDTSRMAATEAVSRLVAGQAVAFRLRLPPSTTVGGSKPPLAKPDGFTGTITFWLLISALFGLSIIIPVLYSLTTSGGPLETTWGRVNPFAYARVAAVFGAEGSGPGLLDDPRGIAVGSDGSVFIANYSDGRIQKFTREGKYILGWNVGAEKYVDQLVADRSGQVFAIIRGELAQFDGGTGQLVRRYQHPFERWFSTVTARADGSLVAAANQAEMVVIIPGEGTVQLATLQTGEAMGVESLAVDGVGNLYLLTDDDAVQVLSPDGRLLARFGSPGDEPGQLSAPQAIAVDFHSRIYVSDMDGIQVFSQDGRFLAQLNIAGIAFSLATDAQGDLWAVSSEAKVVRFNLPDD